MTSVKNTLLLLFGALFACSLSSSAASAAPSISLGTSSGPPTSTILVSGSGFARNVAVDIYFDTQDMALAVTNGNGTFSNIPINASKSAPPGEHWVSAVERNDHKAAQKPFLVETDWTEGRFDAGLSGLNPYENVLNSKSARDLKLNWSDSNIGVIFSIPAVAKGVVYLASQDSNLYALRATSGQILWKYTDKGGSISSSPAVANGMVYFGGYDGVHAVNTSTGQLVWQYYSTPASVFSLTLSDDQIYFNTTDGYAHALDAKTGSNLWSYNAGNFSVVSAPAVANGVVYVAAGDLVALDAKTGTFQWSYPIGNSATIWSSPTVTNGVVYVGSNDGSVYAISAASHSLLWSYATGAQISANPAAANGVVYASSQDGHLYAFDAHSGSVLWKHSSKSPGSSPSSPALANGVVYVAQDLYNLVALNARTGTLLWQYGVFYPSAPSVADGVVYLGDQGNLYAFGLTHAKSEKGSPIRPDPRTLHPDFHLGRATRGM